MAEVHPSPRDWLSPGPHHLSPARTPAYSPTRSPAKPCVDDEEMDDICNSMEKLLRKGERCQLQTTQTVRTITIKEEWTWPAHAQGVVRYLDASCLLFGEQRCCLEVVDFSHRSSEHNVGEYAAVKHSGDQLWDEERLGQHSIEVHLERLGPNIQEMFITISAFEPANLADIVAPSVSISDGESGERLCTYELEEQPKDLLTDSTSVIMCRVYRSAQDAHVWEVEALGHLGLGSANNYGCMIHYITDTLPLLRTLGTWAF